MNASRPPDHEPPVHESTTELDTGAAFSAELVRLIDGVVAEGPLGRDRLIGLLCRVREHLGWVPASAQELIADRLGLAAMDVATVVDSWGCRLGRPPAQVRVEVCRGTGCVLEGGRTLVEMLGAVLGLEPGGVTSDGRFSLDVVPCLGACECSPAVCVNGRVVGPLTPGGLRRLLESFCDPSGSPSARKSPQ